MKSAYIDANVILRFLTGDPPEMAAEARTLFEALDHGEINLFIDEIVLAEVVWVLSSFYGYASDEIARVLQEFIGHEGLQAMDKAGLFIALNLFAEKNIDFTDALVATHMAREGFKGVYSFDAHFDRVPGITRLEPGVSLPS
jgi:predicted nucleic acid-binding protein